MEPLMQEPADSLASHTQAVFQALGVLAVELVETTRGALTPVFDVMLDVCENMTAEEVAAAVVINDRAGERVERRLELPSALPHDFCYREGAVASR
ncbi:MAG: hypothetical protein K8U57_23680 [Planctomycetes bacterium]|nr:hypothetical protein [Planctomycetota bacterium]